MFDWLKPKTTVEIHKYGSDFERTQSFGRTVEKGSHEVLKFTTNNPQQALPEISKLIASQSSQSQPLKTIKPVIEPKTIPLLPAEKPAPKKNWFL